jgi:A/G-specific adenine glycosylase
MKKQGDNELFRYRETGSDFAQQLLHWHRHHNQRHMPWKGEQDPYRIWLSEIMLQQTRVEQGLPYYKRFVEAFPTIRDLADAPDQQVFKMWE